MDQFQADSLVWRLVDGGVIPTRRERIATAVLQGILAGLPDDALYLPERSAINALRHADALIAALDKEDE